MNDSLKNVNGALALVLALVLTCTQIADATELPHAFAAARAATPMAPPPAQIASAHTVFLTNSGADANFPLDATESYNDIYSALQAWGHYRLVAAPDEADLVFQLHGIAPITNVTGGRGGVYSVTSPAFELTIVDPKSNLTLWTITSPVNVVGKKEVRASWVSIAEANLVSRIKVLAGVPLSTTETADLTTVPKDHRTRNTLILVGVGVGVAVAAGLIVHHEFENSVANQKASQDAFCNANHIPLSECAGG